MIKIKKPSDAPPALPGGEIWKLLASFFGIGFSPVAPGTIASAMAFIILWFIPTNHWIYWISCIGFVLFGVIVSTKAERYWGKDPSKIVIDEVAGSMVSVMMLPKNIYLWAIALLAFRAYDIIKLPPARTAENKLPRGWAVMLDDVVAGIYSFALVQIIRFLFFESLG